jgi:hypothetical protein
MEKRKLLFAKIQNPDMQLAEIMHRLEQNGERAKHSRKMLNFWCGLMLSIWLWIEAVRLFLSGKALYPLASYDAFFVFAAIFFYCGLAGMVMVISYYTGTIRRRDL